LRKSQPNNAATKGEVLMRKSEFATVVRVTERIKRKKDEARNAPASSPGNPTAATYEIVRLP
jgi:hypothetical protein